MLQSHTRFALAATALVVATTAAPSSIESTHARATGAVAAAALDSVLLKTYKWRSIGPDRGGRSIAATGVKGRPKEAYFGAVGGGLWKTTDGGASWVPVTDGQVKSASVGAVAVSESNPDVVYIGMGESCIRGNIMAGDGVYKSTDAGKTWTHIGFDGGGKQNISKIRVHPTNPDIVWVAVFGYHGAPNDERGVFKTTDGGRTWKRIFYRSPQTGAIDLVMDPANPNTLYASMWQRVRRKWSDPRVEPGYNEGGIWKTTDGGNSWAEVNTGLPAAQFRGRIGIDISRSTPSVLYAFVDNYEPGRPAREGERDAYSRPIQEPRIKAAEVYRTDDKGATWKKASDSNEFMSGHSGTYGWVFGQIRVDPKDDKTIYSMGLGLNVSRDGGKTFTPLKGMHGDHHGLWIDPANSSILYNANDGGFYSSTDAGATWKFAVSAGGAQFYNVTLDDSTPAWAYGSIQDIGSRRGKVDVTAGRDKIPAVEWANAPGGEGSYQAIDPENPNIVYSHGFYGNFTRTDLSIPAPQRGRGAGAGEGRAGTAAQGGGRSGPQRSTPIRPPEDNLRAQWMAPILVSPHSASTIYAGFQYVFRSTDRGAAWEKISADLSDNDPARMLRRSSSEIPYQTVSALAESPRKRGLLYAGTDDGRLHVTMDDGKQWSELTAGLRFRKWISRVVPSQHAEGTVYITQRGREDDDFAPYIYKSSDYGKTLTSIVNNIPAGPVNVIREDPTDPNILYAGTDFGAFITVDGGRRWQVLGANLPSVQVSDLQVQPRDHVIVISTYGRGMWAMDATKVRSLR
jgi:photosystem II stability/assembly factor-like uncharacterized protein